MKFRFPRNSSSHCYTQKKITQSYIFTEFVFSFFNRQQVDCGSSSVQDFTNRKQQKHESLTHSNFLQFVLFFLTQFVFTVQPKEMKNKNKTTKKNN